MAYLVCPICKCGTAQQLSDPTIIVCPKCGRLEIIAILSNGKGELKLLAYKPTK